MGREEVTGYLIKKDSCQKKIAAKKKKKKRPLLKKKKNAAVMDGEEVTRRLLFLFLGVRHSRSNRLCSELQHHLEALHVPLRVALTILRLFLAILLTLA